MLCTTIFLGMVNHAGDSNEQSSRSILRAQSTIEPCLSVEFPRNGSRFELHLVDSVRLTVQFLSINHVSMKPSQSDP